MKSLSINLTFADVKFTLPHVYSMLKYLQAHHARDHILHIIPSIKELLHYLEQPKATQLKAKRVILEHLEKLTSREYDPYMSEDEFLYLVPRIVDDTLLLIIPYMNAYVFNVFDASDPMEVADILSPRDYFKKYLRMQDYTIDRISKLLPYNSAVHNLKHSDLQKMQEEKQDPMLLFEMLQKSLTPSKYHDPALMSETQYDAEIVYPQLQHLSTTKAGDHIPEHVQQVEHVDAVNESDPDPSNVYDRVYLGVDPRREHHNMQGHAESVDKYKELKDDQRGYISYITKQSQHVINHVLGVALFRVPGYTSYSNYGLPLQPYKERSFNIIESPSMNNIANVMEPKYTKYLELYKHPLSTSFVYAPSSYIVNSISCLPINYPVTPTCSRALQILRTPMLKCNRELRRDIPKHHHMHNKQYLDNTLQCIYPRITPLNTLLSLYGDRTRPMVSFNFRNVSYNKSIGNTWQNELSVVANHLSLTNEVKIDIDPYRNYINNAIKALPDMLVLSPTLFASNNPNSKNHNIDLINPEPLSSIGEFISNSSLCNIDIEQIIDRIDHI